MLVSTAISTLAKGGILMIGKIIAPGVIPAGFTVVARKERVREIVTLSYNDCLLRTARRHNAPKGKPQWLRRLSNAYERGEHGISKRVVVGRVFRYDIVGRLAAKFPRL